MDDRSRGDSESTRERRDWRFIERVVALLEKTLAPEARVSVNEYLPELATGTIRQCDVVVRTGRPPRETLTIVEVQDRGRKVELATYEGWCRKREKLGAQQLISVSRNGFPESVHKDAVLRGHTVRLMILCEPDDPPEFVTLRTVMINMTVLEKREGEVILHKPPRPILDKPPLGCDKVFQRERHQGMWSLSDLADFMISQGLAKELGSVELGSGRYRCIFYLDFGQLGERVWLQCDEHLVGVRGARVADTVEYVHRTLPIQILAYEQSDFEGSLAWIVVATGEYEGKQYYIQIPYVAKGGKPVWTGQVVSSRIPGLTYESEVIEIGYKVD